jgi:heme-degrading monooxygenase HmoA
MHARVVMYTFKPGTIDALIKQAEAGLLPIFRKHAGFRSYQVIKTGPDTGISLSTWQSEADAKAAVKLGADWVKANMAKDVISAETKVGTVSFSHRPSRRP